MSRIKLQLCFTLMIALLGSISCMQAEKISLDTSGAEGALIGLVAGDLNLLGGGEVDHYTGFRFVAGGNEAFWHSEDGMAWKSSFFDGGNVKAIVFGNGTWVAVGADSAGSTCKIWTSTTGKEWTSVPCSGTPRTGVAYGNGKFIVTGGTKTVSSTIYPVVLQSLDNGEHWTELTALPSNNQEMASVAYIKPQKKFVLAANGIPIGGSPPDPNAFLYDDNLNTFTPIALPSYAYAIKVKEGASGQILVAGYYLDTFANKAYWTYAIGTVSGGSWSLGPENIEDLSGDYTYSFAYGNGRHVAVGNNYQGSCKIYHSIGGASWQPWNTFENCNNFDWYSVAFSPASSLFVAGGKAHDLPGATFAWSDNGSDWNFGNSFENLPTPTVIAVAK